MYLQTPMAWNFLTGHGTPALFPVLNRIPLLSNPGLSGIAVLREASQPERPNACILAESHRLVTALCCLQEHSG
jgi:hypothetical protein